MKCKYKYSDFKKGQLLVFYRHKNKLLAFSICPTKQYSRLQDLLEIAEISLIDKVNHPKAR